MSENAKFDLNSVVETAKQILTQPKQFYQQMPNSGGYTNPLIFVVVMGLATGVLGAVFSLFTQSHWGSMSFGLISIIVMPIVAVIGCFISSAIMFVIWKLMGSSESFETAFRCVAHTAVIFPLAPILGLIPYLGTIATNAWLVWMMILASVAVHKLDQNKTYIVIGILGALLILMNVSGERQQRHFQDRYENFNKQMGELENMSPEELGKAAGEFLKGLEEASGTNSE